MEDGQAALGQRDRFKRRLKEKKGKVALPTYASDNEACHGSSENSIEQRTGGLHLSERRQRDESATRSEQSNGSSTICDDERCASIIAQHEHEVSHLPSHQAVRNRIATRSRPHGDDEEEEEEAVRQDVFLRCTHFVCFQIDSLTILQRAATIQVMHVRNSMFTHVRNCLQINTQLDIGRWFACSVLE